MKLISLGTKLDDHFFKFALFTTPGFILMNGLFFSSHILALFGRPLADRLLSVEAASSAVQALQALADIIAFLFDAFKSPLIGLLLLTNALCLLLARIEISLSLRALSIAFFGIFAFAVSFISHKSFIISCLLITTYFIISCLAALYDILRAEASASFLQNTLDICIKFVQLSFLVFSIGLGLLRFVSVEKGVDEGTLLAVFLFFGGGYFFNIALFAIFIIVPIWLLHKTASMEECNNNK